MSRAKLSAELVVLALTSAQLFSCRSDPAPSALAGAAPSASASAAPSRPALPARGVAAGLRYVELVTGGAVASDPLPLIVALHGLGDSGEGFMPLFEGFEAKARIVAFSAPAPWGDGFAWFPVPKNERNESQLADGLRLAAQAVAGATLELRSARPTVGRAIVTGFSQGAMTSFAVAVLHGDMFSAAFPVAGLLPKPLMLAPNGGARHPQIVALHGQSDRRVPFELGQATVGSLANAGFSAKLESFPAVEHTVSPEMRRRLFSLLREACESARAGP